MSRTVRTLQGDTVDAVVWREYDAPFAALPLVLEANPHVAALPPELPIGTELVLPEPPPPAPRARVEIWD